MKPSTTLGEARTTKKESSQAKTSLDTQSTKFEKLGEGVPSLSALQLKYLNDADKLADDHEKLIEQILEDEEQLIFKHNASCKEGIQIVEKEMALLKEVDKPGSDVEQYVEKLDQVLVMKIKKMIELRKSVLEFYKNIKTEQLLNQLFQENQ